MKIHAGMLASLHQILKDELYQELLTAIMEDQRAVPVDEARRNLHLTPDEVNGRIQSQDASLFQTMEPMNT